MNAYHIVIVADPFSEGHVVEIKPTPGGIGHDRLFDRLAEARRYAGRLSAATSWPIHDLTGDPEA